MKEMNGSYRENCLSESCSYGQKRARFVGPEAGGFRQENRVLKKAEGKP